jgi:hypothetical protein
MNAKQKAEDITTKIVKAQGSRFLYPVDKLTAVLMVEEIIDALGSTGTKEGGVQEGFWEDVKSEIEAMSTNQLIITDGDW